MFSVKANIRAQEERERRRLEKQEDKEFIGPVRQIRKFEFNAPGKYISLADDMRKQARRLELQKRIELASQRTGIKDFAKLASEQKEEEQPTLVEWWDILLLKGRSLEEVVQRLKTTEPDEIFDGITHLVEHPIVQQPPIDTSKAPPPLIYLTKKEQKRLRRTLRAEANRKKQEQIKLGLEAAPEPRLTKSNMMLALGGEAILDPSKSEAKVKEQISQRKQAHLEHNEAKKLTGEQKKEKKLRKFQEDLSMTGIHVIVYRVLNLSSSALKYKVSINAKQLTMTGIILLYKDINVIVVEGGPKQQKKFKRLMLNRINWSEYDDCHDDKINDQQDAMDTSDGQDKKIVNKCLLVWEGQVKERAFKDIKIKQVPNETAARDLFKTQKCEHYWDLAFKVSILDSINSI